MMKLSEQLATMPNTFRAPVTPKPTPQLGSTSDDGKRITMTSEGSSLQSNLPAGNQLAATPITPLPPSVESQLAVAVSSNLSPFNIQLAANKTQGHRDLLETELQRLRQSLWNASDEEIIIMLGKLVTHCPTRNLAESQFSALFEDYVEELRKFPALIVATACKTYRMNPENQFFPSLAVLVAGCKSAILPTTQRIAVIEKILATPPEPVITERPPVDLSGLITEFNKPQFSTEQRMERTLDWMKEKGATQSEMDAVQRFGEGV